MTDNDLLLVKFHVDVDVCGNVLSRDMEISTYKIDPFVCQYDQGGFHSHPITLPAGTAGTAGASMSRTTSGLFEVSRGTDRPTWLAGSTDACESIVITSVVISM